MATSLAVLSAPALADPTDVDRVIADMEGLSREAEANTEELKSLEDKLVAQQGNVEQLAGQTEGAKLAAQAALDALDQRQRDVNTLSLAKFRGANVDPITTVVGARDPQSAIDRSAYAAALSRRQESVLTQLEEANKAAAAEHSRVAAAQAEAEYARTQLEDRKAELEEKQHQLEAKQNHLREVVDGFSPEDRQRWLTKNGPVQFDLAGISSSNQSGMSALEAGMTKIGSPYGWGAVGPDQFDCSGLVVWSYQQQGKQVPRTSQAQMAGGTPVSINELQPGDVVGFYPGATHVGIYAGNGMILHASDYGIPVQVVPMASMPFYGARRY